ncbi:hypothetical protein CONLIGDRAFT_649864 [Coniochaeta ligniaria NRRL 30616]|uniref:Uncharacterized protein n=1 Tax=Coniochaeta ligniaria NRRL 30616 TaxID=1408157 RepID=A0A1J7I7L0_9PEZI|nr:hypothetical protein CONLIGDRAFT_649864 [Coniochaeta ligniaria NRRL 30616]
MPVSTSEELPQSVRLFVAGLLTAGLAVTGTSLEREPAPLRSLYHIAPVLRTRQALDTSLGVQLPSLHKREAAHKAHPDRTTGSVLTPYALLRLPTALLGGHTEGTLPVTKRWRHLLVRLRLKSAAHHASHASSSKWDRRLTIILHDSRKEASRTNWRKELAKDLPEAHTLHEVLRARRPSETGAKYEAAQGRSKKGKQEGLDQMELRVISGNGGMEWTSPLSFGDP